MSKLKFALVGQDISYSLSPTIHGEVFKYYNIDAEYKLISCTAEQLESVVKELKYYNGFNVTKPHKQNILKYVKSTHAAVNTVVVKNGKFTAYNTDGDGFINDLSDFLQTNGIKLKDIAGMQTLLLGAGGAAQIIAKQLCQANLDVSIFNRTEQRAQQLARAVGASAITPDKLVSYKPQLIINCTSLGLGGENSLPTTDLSQIRFAYDTIYNPPQTPFLTTCVRAGAKICNGLGMLIKQALKADQYFLNIEISDIDRQILTKKIMEEINS